ncbi:MAG: DUF3575 domain-containing protein [Bacteroidetes bacterium]|nr:MAG: DUF3575 domain-containing protein [Bacteroidota bacterium]
MKKAITSFFTAFILFISAQAQEVGYNTTDIGAEYQNYSDCNIIKLHVAFNSKLHHSFHFSVGYNSMSNDDLPVGVKEFSGGIAAGLGYRYYFAYRVHGIFIGARFDFLSGKTELSTSSPETRDASRLMPAAELGYMFLINDMFFITPSVSLGARLKLNSESDLLDEGFTFLPGVSIGFKF